MEPGVMARRTGLALPTMVELSLTTKMRAFSKCLVDSPDNSTVTTCVHTCEAHPRASQRPNQGHALVVRHVGPLACS